MGNEREKSYYNGGFSLFDDHIKQKKFTRNFFCHLLAHRLSLVVFIEQQIGLVVVQGTRHSNTT